MQNKQLFAVIFGLLLSHFFKAQVIAPSYHSPLGIPLKLSASFGDLRPNHFHMGVDFRTEGKVGLSLYSIEAGYVARIKITPLGYGRVIYVNHPNGVTSVYAHCTKFEKSIQAIVKLYQEKNQLNEIDLVLEPQQIPVTKGQLIAYSGNSGNSFGPHLHFELRDTKTENALHPLVHGINIVDQQAPVPSKLYIYAIDQHGYYINDKKIAVPIIKKGTEYTVATNKIIIPPAFMNGTNKLLIGIEGSDKIGADLSTCGLFENVLIVANDTIFHSRIDTVSFSHDRLINDYCDYHEYKTNNKKIHKLIHKTNNHLDVYKSDPLKIINLKGHDSIPINIQLLDAKKNRSTIKFDLVYRSTLGKIVVDSKPSGLYLIPDSSYYFEDFGNSITLNALSLFEPVKKNLIITKDKIQLGKASTPIFEGAKVTMTPIENTPITKQYIYLVGDKDQKEALKTQLINGKLEAVISSLGTFKVGSDFTPPSVTPSNFVAGDTSLKKNSIEWKVSDAKTNISSYNLFINGKWKVLEYDKKNKLLIHVFEPSEKGLINFKLQVKDACGNEALWTKKIRIN